MSNRSIRASLAAALQSVRDGARESGDVYVWELNGHVSYLRTSRGIVRLLTGPDGQRFSERVVER